MSNIGTKIYGWLDERYDLTALVEFGKKKTVPIHRESVWYYFGGLSLFLFMVQVMSGVLLLLYYRPGADQAYESVKFIVTNVEFGWLVRAIHSWSANLMIFAAFIHMFSVYFTKAYRKPRELTWITGMIMFFLAMGFGFSGYLLPWNELAFFATKVGTDIVGVVPGIGEFLMKVLRGGDDVTGATLSRFFGFHIALLPAIFSAFLGLHLMLVQKLGMSTPIEYEKADNSNLKTMPFFPNFMLRDALLWLIVLNVLAILAVFFPFGIGPLHWPLGLKADPFAPAPAGIQPEWYFMFMFQTLKMIPGKVLFIEGELLGIFAFGAAGLAWTLVPFWDKKSARGEKNKLINILGIAAIAFIILMTAIGWL